MSGDTSPHVVLDNRGIIQILSNGTIVRSDPAVLGRRSASRTSQARAMGGRRVRHGARPQAARVQDSRRRREAAARLPSGCLRLPSELPAVVLSADYRLAPEHGLPAAIDDGAAALSWHRGQALLGAGAHPCLAKSADFTKVFLAGESSGANMAHHVSVRHGSGQLALDPPQLVSGYVLRRRTCAATEAEPPAGGWFTLEASDKMWRLSLPAGANRDHPAANPFGPDSPSLEPVAFAPLLVVSARRDILHDRVLRYAAKLKKLGQSVELEVFEEAQHAFFSREPWGEAANELIRAAKLFLQKNSGAAERN
ncbi:hypothetical protein EJB05_31426, partial [Eragrostis curvula]